MRSEDEDFRRKSRQRVADARAKREPFRVKVSVGPKWRDLGRGGKVRLVATALPHVFYVEVIPGE
jgi:hypothetical protein